MNADFIIIKPYISSLCFLSKTLIPFSSRNMPPKRILLPPSSDEDKDEHYTDGPDSDDEEVSSEDEEQPQQHQIKSQKLITQTHSESEDDEDEEIEEERETPPPKKSTSPKPQSPSDSDSGSGSDSELGNTKHSPTASDFAVKPIASKPMPMGDSTKPRKPTNSKTYVAAPVVKPSAKRAIEVVEQNRSKDSKSKRKKVANGDADNEEKKSAVTRLWSENDEIVILQGMVDYWSKRGTDPYADMGAFHEFIKGSLSVDVSKTQLTDKIRRLKKKYQNNVEKNGEDAVFSRPHEYKSFELSKKIWGGAASNSGVDDSAKSNNGHAKRNASKVNNNSNALVKPKDEGKAIVVVEKAKGKDEGNAIVVVEKAKGKDEIQVASRDFTKLYPYFNSALDVQWEREPFLALSEEDKRLMKEKLGRNSRVQEVNEEFKMLKLKELELYSKKLELMKEMTGMFIGALKSEE